MREAARPASATTVGFGHAGDAALAAAVAELLPALGPDSPVRVPGWGRASAR